MGKKRHEKRYVSQGPKIPLPKGRDPSARCRAICRDCALKQSAGGWGKASSPRCKACGGLLDKVYVVRDRLAVVYNPNALAVAQGAKSESQSGESECG